ncbi:hypothetical protein [Nonomuraea sp. NPDC005501]|uniref:hypothetical protein n=1 Tax=Nonomuraea sp. NPDC005501 TaxID=3156884 RepID=UPI0033B1D78C
MREVDTRSRSAERPKCSSSATVELSRLTALVEAQHPPAADRDTFALLKNPYDVGLIGDGERWGIRRMRIDNAWYVGGPAAIFAG